MYSSFYFYFPVPVHIPEKYAEKYNFSPGTVDDRLLNFVDFVPTLLQMAGAEIAQDYPGTPFISENPVEEQPYIYGTSDRVDEGYEVVRTNRTKKYSYIRNFLPHLPLLQSNFYTDHSEIMQELNRVREADDLTAAQKTMFAQEKMPEALYGVENDPYQVHNLAGDPTYRDTLLSMRQTLVQEILKNFDTGFMPEPKMLRLAENTIPYEVAHHAEIYRKKQRNIEALVIRIGWKESGRVKKTTQIIIQHQAKQH